ncbi:MAG: helix-turn-helix domain-containing protein [Herpetosiphon sp.]
MRMSDTHTESEWLTLSQASELLGVHPATLRLWSDEGKIGLFRTPGGHRRFARTEVERLLHVLPVRGEGLSAYVASETVQRTRRDMASAMEQQPWMQQLTIEDRDQWRVAGRQMVALVSRLAAGSATSDAQHASAKALGRAYGALLNRAGLDLPDAVLTFLFFRDSLVETIFQLPSTTGLDREATLSALRRVNAVLNDVLRIAMQQWTGAGVQ